MLKIHYENTPIQNILKILPQKKNENFQIKSLELHSITKKYLYNFDPIKPHFYIVNLVFTGVLFFIFLLKT